MEREIKFAMKNGAFFEDYPTKERETDIYELSDYRVIAEIDPKDDDGNPSAFTDVVTFFKDPFNGKYMSKFC
jgi:hypothetical protein